MQPDLLAATVPDATAERIVAILAKADTEGLGHAILRKQDVPLDPRLLLAHLEDMRQAVLDLSEILGIVPRVSLTDTALEIGRELTERYPGVPEYALAALIGRLHLLVIGLQAINRLNELHPPKQVQYVDNQGGSA